MATPDTRAERDRSPEKLQRARIRNRIFTVIVLMLIIASLFTFLLNYSGFNAWRDIDTNLSIFIAVNVNIVLLTAVFYMILRNLFKLVYERKRPLSGVGLKTKLIIAFVALSLPSTGFHLAASGFMAYLMEAWSRGEQRQVLDSAQVVMDALENREGTLLRLNAENLISYLPREKRGFQGSDWLSGRQPRHTGGVVVYDRQHQVIARWSSKGEEAAAWQPPPQEFLAGEGVQAWRNAAGDRSLRHILLPLPNSPDGLRVEVFQFATTGLTEAQGVLTRQRLTNRFLSRDLLLLVLGILVVMTLLIILAATWVSFYLARGFVTPIDRLADGTRRVSQGELGYQVEGSSLGPLQGDFDGLVQSFNLMSRQLQEQRHQLVETTENLQQSHHELGERTRLVELLLENIDAGIVSLDPQGRITSANRAAKRLAQLRGDSWLGAHYQIALGKKFVALLDEMRERLLGDAERHITQNLTVPQNRKPVHIEVTLLSLENKEGISEGTVVILKDVTAMQRNQRALAWQEVARRVAHEIKNPLTPIQLSAQRIRRKYLHNGGEEDGILDQSTQTIIREVTSLKKMVNEFSHFAQLPESQPVPGDLNKVIREVAGLYESGLPEHVQIDLKLETNLPPLPLDRDQMKRVFNNLIDNAVASLPASRRGRITISTALNPEANTIVVEVMDDGTGVPEEVRDRLFEPYATSKEGGTGLGLTIVNQIVSDHFGYIRYSERKPRGSVFSIEFQSR